MPYVSDPTGAKNGPALNTKWSMDLLSFLLFQSYKLFILVLVSLLEHIILGMNISVLRTIMTNYLCTSPNMFIQSKFVLKQKTAYHVRM